MNRFFRVAISLLFALTIVSSIAQADQLALPAADVTAPVLEQKNLVNKIEVGKDHQILVTATDNIAIKNVILFYREIGGNVYQNKVMRNIPNTDDYTITLSASELQGDGVEYYIQAIDHAGNTLLLGYAFSPIAVLVEHRGIKDQMASSSAMDSKKPAEKVDTEKSNKWLWIGLSVLAVGAIAASGGGGGGGGDGGSSGEPTVVINAPVP